MVKTAVLVSGGGTNLQALINAEKKGLLGPGKLSLVISNREGAFALKRAEKAGIPSLTVTKKQCGSKTAFEEALKKILKEREIELIVLAGFLTILSEDFVKGYERRILNIHPALIPSFSGKGYYGLKVHEEALKYGVKVTGATVHFVSEIPDGGEIILQKAVKVQQGDTPESLQKRVMRLAEWQILPKAVRLVAEEIEKEREERG